MLFLSTKFFELIISLFNSLSRPIRETIVWVILKILVIFAPRYKKIALKNLKVIYPEEKPAFYSKTINDSYWRFARILADSLFLPRVDKAWLDKNVKFSRLDEWLSLFNNGPPGLIISSAHIGSFEVTLRCTAVYGGPMAVVYRNIDFKPLNTIWVRELERFGNLSINRNGAFRKVLSQISRGFAVGLVADQNVRREHAIFRPFFGKIASTSKALGVAAVKMKAPIVFVWIKNERGGTYTIDWERLSVEKIYEDSSLDFNAKVEQITDIYNRKLECEIRNDPASWFLMHRRWKTTPEGTPEDFYD